MTALLQVECPPKHLEDYRQFNSMVVNQILESAQKLEGIKVVHLNATSSGGGVAELLRYVVPILQDIGMDSKWYVLPPNKDFFEVTKQIHNFLQGKPGNLSTAQKKIYLDYSKYISSLLDKVTADILIIHDPQPAAALSFLKKKPNLSIWLCHIDTTNPNESVWQFILPYLKIFDHFVFTLSEFVPPEINKEKVSLITSAIDPLSEKNRLISKSMAKKYISRFGINTKKPLIAQISRFDPWKDPLGVIDVYRITKKIIPDLQLALVAKSAADDPEGVKIYRKVQRHTHDEKGIFLLINLPDSDMATNAFQTAPDVILQKSIKEGFGLTVTESMWKGTVVIGGNAGGIKLQIQDGVNGFLVNTSEEAAQKIIFILKHPEVAKKISSAARISVKNRFLLPNHILNWLNLFLAQIDYLPVHS